MKRKFDVQEKLNIEKAYYNIDVLIMRLELEIKKYEAGFAYGYSSGYKNGYIDALNWVLENE